MFGWRHDQLGRPATKVALTNCPGNFEAGTPNVADVIACGAAIDYLNKLGMAQIRAHEIAITDYALKKLSGFARRQYLRTERSSAPWAV